MAPKKENRGGSPGSLSAVVAATVRLPQLRCQGVLVPGELILTAAHCIKWPGDGEMVLGVRFFEPVQTHDGRTFRASVYAVDHVSDIAALGPPDDPEVIDDYLAFSRFAEEVGGVPIRRRPPAANRDLPVWVLKPSAEWVTGTATRMDEGCSLLLKTKTYIKGGTSGGPVVDRAGHLVGVISNSSELEDYIGTIPVPHLALPRWLGERILRAQRRIRG